MRILIVSTLKRKVGAYEFASRSRIIYQLGRGLVKKGHEVSLLGTEDSLIPGVSTISVIEKSWVDSEPVENEFLKQTSSLARLAHKLIDIQNKFDIIHSHTYPDFFPSILENDLKIPMVTTLHATYDDYMDETLALFPKTHFVALSKGYQRLYKKANIEFVIYNSVDTDLYEFSKEKEDYLFWLGRLPKGKDSKGNFIDPKGVRNAIRLAQLSGLKLKLYGACEDREFFERDVKPHLNDKIQWIGDVSSEQSLPVKKIIELMQQAKAIIMSINQEEPFGLVMAEAGSCGTPVIAFNRGSVTEIIVDGKTGFVVDPKEGVKGLNAAVKKISQIDPEYCRVHIEKNFGLQKMVDNYEKIYFQLTHSNGSSQK